MEDGLFRDYWEPFVKDIPNWEYLTGFDLDLDAWEYLLYFTYEPLTRFLYNKEVQPSRVFEKNMEKAIEKFCIGLREKAIVTIRNRYKELAEELKSYTITDGDLTYHVEFIWRTENGENTCDVCHSYNGKRLETIKNIHPHFNCRCYIEKHSWYTDKDGKILYENVEIL